MPLSLAQAVALRYHEREGTTQLLSKQSAKSVKVACRGAACACPRPQPSQIQPVVPFGFFLVRSRSVPVRSGANLREQNP